MNSKLELIDDLYGSYRQELLLYLCKKYHFSTEEAEDFVQLTFSRLSRVDAIEDIDNIRAYIYKTANNLVIDDLRVKERHERWVREETNSIDLESSSLYDPERVEAARQELNIIQRALKKMSVKRRNFLKLSRYDNLSNVEIARQQGISEAAVRKHIAKALKELKQSLEDPDIDEN